MAGLLRVTGPLALAALADGRFSRFLLRSSADRLVVTLEDVRRLTEAQVLVLARYAWEASPQVFGRLAQMLQSEDPTLLRTLTGALFLLALGMQSRGPGPHSPGTRRPLKVAPAQPGACASRIHCSTDSGAGMRPGDELAVDREPRGLQHARGDDVGHGRHLDDLALHARVGERLQGDLLQLAAIGAAGAVDADGEHGQVPLGMA